MHRHPFRFVRALALAALFGTTPAAQAKGIAPLAARTSDQVIARDLRAIAELDARLAAVGGDPWRRSRARALLVAARNEYLDNDRTGFDVAAFAEAERLAGELERGAPEMSGASVPVTGAFGGSTRVREDLWSALASIKHGEGFACAAEDLARAEVELLWAGNEQVDQGDCRTSPHLTEATRHLEQARVRAAACAPPPPVAIIPKPPAAPLPPSQPVIAPETAVPTREELRIPRNVHFALDKYHLSARSRQVIAGIVDVMKRYPGVTVRLEGHTDSRASVAYNMRLSRNRVNGVRDALVSAGIAVRRITTAFKGESELKTSEDSNANFARNRRVEMVFVDSEGRDIHAEDQEEDLQLESAAPTRRGAGRRR